MILKIFKCNGAYFEKVDTPNYHVPLVIFQTYKIAILNNVHFFKWFLILQMSIFHILFFFLFHGQ
jgi:hypothetical protein